MDWLALIPTILSAAGTVREIVAIATSNHSIVEKVTESLPTLAAALEKYGGDFFPNVRPELRIAAAAMTAYDSNTTKWVQGSLNAFLELDPPLWVDGSYGPKTKAAVELAQAKLGLRVDGWAGQLTNNAIQAFLLRGSK